MKFLIFILIIIAITFLLLQISNYYDHKVGTQMKIDSTVLNLELADTEAKRVQGLSGRDSLPETTGLLFVFPQEGYHGFWMKDMKFPIDIVWIDKNKKIISFQSNLSPDTYPQVFYPSLAALYVLETNANFLQNHQIKIGDSVEF